MSFGGVVVRLHPLNQWPHLELLKDPWGGKRPAGLISFVNELYLREGGTDLGLTV